MKFHSPVIFVKDIEKSQDFYIRILNQEIEHDFGKNVILKSGLALWEINEKHIISQELETKVQSNKFELYFETEQIDETYNKLKGENIEFLHDINEEPWGQKTIRFFDPDKHLIEIGENLETFVKNMKKDGLTSGQIVEKSGIPIETVIELLK